MQGMSGCLRATNGTALINCVSVLSVVRFAGHYFWGSIITVSALGAATGARDPRYPVSNLGCFLRRPIAFCQSSPTTPTVRRGRLTYYQRWGALLP